jgi:hypothetical protein
MRNAQRGDGTKSKINGRLRGFADAPCFVLVISYFCSGIPAAEKKEFLYAKFSSGGASSKPTKHKAQSQQKQHHSPV